MEKSIEKTFWLTFAAALIIKMFLALLIPMTSDEAYFVLWGRYVDFGYYDHPPMIGWLLYLLTRLGSSDLLMRMPAILFSSLAGAGIYLVLRPYDRVKAALTGMLFTLSPINVLNVLVTTDAPLLIFSFLSGCFFYRAREEDTMAHYALSGAMLGLAFLSKYFAVLLGLAYLVYFLSTKKTGKRAGGLALLYLCVVPFVLVNVYWNYTHCWANIMFNVFNRNRQEVFSLGKMATFAVCQLYLLTPPVIYFLYKKRKSLRELWAGRGPLEVFFVLFAVPLAVFAVLSFKKVIGLHWVLSFYPFLFLCVPLLLNESELVKSIKFMTVFTLVHLIMIGAALSLPLSVIKHNKNYPTIIVGMRPTVVLTALLPYINTYQLATPSYADSALLEYHFNRHVAVFGGGSHHARHDDILTDFTALNGSNILILRTSSPRSDEYQQYFVKVEVRPVRIEEATFYLVLGQGFRYPVYRQQVLEPIRQKYYDIPTWLPVKSCYFREKYFKDSGK